MSIVFVFFEQPRKIYSNNAQIINAKNLKDSTLPLVKNVVQLCLMALVAYDYGSDSEGEDEEFPKNCEELPTEDSTVNSTAIIKNDVNNLDEISDEDEDLTRTQENGVNITSCIAKHDEVFSSEQSQLSTLFNKLPSQKVEESQVAPKVCDDIIEDFVPKAEIKEKRKAKVRISIPSLSDFDHIQEVEPLSKKVKKSNVGSGLLSLLPPVKCVPISNKTFVPKILTQKTKTSSEQIRKPDTSLVPDSVRKKRLLEKKKGKEDGSDDSDIDLPDTFDEELWQKTCGRVSKKKIIEEPVAIDQPEDHAINIAPTAVAPYEGLDNTAFKELVGKSRRIPQNIKLIDINEEQLVAEKDLWMTKSLTDPEYIHKKPIEDPVDPTKRKKHHITYLAEQAKANEQELQNQWSASKFNRNQTRAKYGF